MGGKAYALAKLHNKFPVPEWFVVTPQALSGDISNGIEGLLNKWGDGPYAVRSSAVDEDNAGHSFAGQLQSFLNVAAADVSKKIDAVRDSGMTESVQAYRRQNGLSEEQSYPAVLIQKMVNADMAGVAFTADPVSHNRDIITIIATAGLADRLVSGEVNGDTYHLSRQGIVQSKQLADQSPVLSESQLEEISSLAQKVEYHFGCPQDIEWAYEKENLYLLQARPITTLEEDHDVIIWDNSNIVESYSGVTSPLTFSFARYVYGEVYKSFSLLMGVPRRKVMGHGQVFTNMLGYIQGHVYYNLLNWYRVLALFPGFTLNRGFMENMMGVSQPLPEYMLHRIAPQNTSRARQVMAAVRMTGTLFCLIGNAAVLPWRVQKFYKHLNKILDLSGKPLSDSSYAELAAYYRQLETKLLAQWHTPIINDFLCMIAFGASRKILISQDAARGQQLHNDYMIGQGDIISAEPAQRIQEMAEIIGGRDNITTLLVKGDLAAISLDQNLEGKFREYLEKFGDRCTQELKLESLTLHEDPAALLQAIGYTARRSYKAEHAAPQDIHERLQEIFKGNTFKRRLVTRLLAWAKSRVRDRENLRFERTRVFGRVRRIFMEMGDRLVQEGLIEQQRDVFYLEIDEILGLAEGTILTGNVKELVATRRADSDTYNNLPELPHRFETSGVLTTPVKMRKTSSVSAVGGEERAGLGCCRGHIRAVVRVINDPRTESLQPGEILVARHTDPGWIALFSNAAGIIVERGSLLSHSAIVAREMGIPAIVAVSDVMTWLVTGDVVEMDGASGKIIRVSHEIQ